MMFKLLIYTHEYPPFRGGAGVYSYDLANGLASLGVEVHVVTICRALAEEGATSLNSNNNVHLHYLDSSKARVQMAHYYLLRLQLLHRFHVVVVTERAAQEVIAQIKYPFFRYASVIHGTEVLDYFGQLSKNLAVNQRKIMRFYKNAFVNIAVSKATHDLAAHLIKCKDVNLVTVQNGINLNRLPAVDKTRVQTLLNQYPENSEFVFCLGRLDLDKGHDVLIPAFKQVRDKRPNAYLLIGGDGPYRQRLTELCDTLKLNGCVDFLGNVSDADLSAYFGLCDVFTLPSKSQNRWEGFGLVFLEANYYGKPVIGGNEGGVPEAIANEETGLVVDPHCVTEIASAIIRLLENEQLREEMGQRGHERVLDYFNSERMAADTFSILKASLFQDTFVRQVKRFVGVMLYGVSYPLFILWQYIRRMLSDTHLSCK